ncbi:outer membrane lipoprotein-sorting protein [Thalassomonas actiniarum]|uniref:Outer membrane lipoprotein-sorting protein n=1 Tax=Thalassomonas actiniarum TaxID=485447 RepID=A0AAE9YWS8_9GAMM|nr:outer membrane lipoprotein-sorting protein [Thalassomonas actiniarum]WDE02313.1 outer membrane lipoprotein-sorting protein [Thalassomonas actiniarum]
MNKLTTILLPIGLVFINPALCAEATSTTVNGQITDAVAQQLVNNPVISEEKITEPAINNGSINEAVGPVPEQTEVAKTDSQLNPQLSAEPDAQQLLEFIDSLRGYQDQSFTFDLSNISFKDNEQKHRNKLAVKVLSDASLVEFTAPARSKGRKILKQAQNMWIRFPGTRNVLRISPAQRLLGEASNGDVTGTNFSEDYTASYQGTEMLNDKQVIKLELNAKHDKTTYKQVMFYLDSENNLPLRSDFYARSGKLAKQAYYTKFKEFDGDLKLHRMKLVDPIVAGSYTWMMFDNYQKQDLDSAIFHKDALTR